MSSGFIDRGINLQIGDVPGLFRPPIQKRFEVLCGRRAIPGRRNLLRRNSSNANFFVGVNRPAEQLLDSGFHARRKLAGLLNRDILHRVIVHFDRTKLLRRNAKRQAPARPLR
jgi:hypothetical protein